jgi:polysaccharide pyruvyl transferase CsaB
MKKYAKNILISGYYGFHNIGDELVLQEIIKGLREQDSSLNITVLSADPMYTRKTYGVKAENRWNLYRIFSSICKAEILISGGGSLLQDKTSKNGILYYLGIIFLGKLFAKKIIVLSQGIGPVNFKRNIYLVKKTLALADYISVRDIESLNVINKIGVNKEVVLTGDPVFLIEKSSEDKVNELWKEIGLKAEKKLIIVALRPWKTFKIYWSRQKNFLVILTGKISDTLCSFS